jgi:hypothetical protein
MKPLAVVVPLAALLLNSTQHDAIPPALGHSAFIAPGRPGMDDAEFDAGHERIIVPIEREARPNAAPPVGTINNSVAMEIWNTVQAWRPGGFVQGTPLALLA